MRLLLVEDDPTLRSQLRAGLDEAGYAVDEADNGRDAHFLGDTEPYDAVIIDLGLPLLDGLTTLKRWRHAGRIMPVLILTARDNWSDKVAGIDAGADDYLTKPFHMEELLARVRGLIRRAAGLASPILQCGDLTLDTRSGRVTLSGQTVALTSHEFKVLEYLMHRPGVVVSRTELIEHIYAQDFDRDSNTIEVFVGRLRKKLPADLIETVRGQGYRLAVT
ncbi:MAG: response regulator transcription factor [Rhodocyclaceae bacterium]|nr:response regulator transcription factor [Rhodocyclaceae bacterium]